MIRTRQLARRYIPFEVRLRLTVLRRYLNDRRAGIRFARNRAESATFVNEVCRYERPIIDYAGQEQFGAAKRHNLALLASQLSGTLIGPGETFSVWQLAPRPSRKTGYAAAAGLRNRQLTSEVGGSTCLLSTVLYNVALLGAMTIEERHCHSVDIYGEERYFELGRDAAIEFGYLDLRFRNSHAFPVLLLIEVGGANVTGSLHSMQPHGFRVEVAAGEPSYETAGERIVFDPALPAGAREVRHSGLPGLRVAASRRVTFDEGTVREEQLEGSVHHPVAAIVATGAERELQKASR